MILVFGSINIDLVAQVPAIARPGETVLSRSAETRFGGKGANQAVAAARARRDPAIAVHMAGAVGADGFGQSARDNLAANGVDTTGLRNEAAPTGWACIAVTPDGENAITVASGANLHATQDQVPDAWLTPDTLLVLQMEVPPEQSLRLARRARDRGGRVLLNLAPAPADLPHDVLAGLLGAVDILVVNEHEAEIAGRALATTAAGVEAMAAAIATHHGVATAVTLGARGAVVALPDGTLQRVAARPVQPVDTTGAGDTFTGVLAASLADGMTLQDAARRACVAGSLACMALGAQAAMPTAAALDQALEAGG
jgi:ribokinase